MNNKTKAFNEEVKNEFDWKQVFAYSNGKYSTPQKTQGATCSDNPFDWHSIKEVIAYTNGENDGPGWVGVFKLHDGRFASIYAWCDYTGWG